MSDVVKPSGDAKTPTELFEQWREFLHIAPVTDVPEIVYHYTGPAGLFGILSEKAIFLSDRHFLNDSTEVSHGRKRATDVLQSSFRKLTDAPRDLLDTTCELINIDDGGRHFIFSMSERDDDLSQWRGYANDGDGYTIGFDGQAIRRATEGIEEFGGFNRVSYSKIQFERLVTNISSQFIDNFPQYEDVQDLASCFSGAIEGAACYHKHTSFRYEREWRIVRFAYPEYSEVEIRETNGKLVPFLRAKLETESFSVPIKSIGIGPAVRNPNAITAVKDLCRVHKVDAEIYSAATPYVRY